MTVAVAGPELRTPAPDEATPTIWGLRPRQVHDRLWAAMGVQVVRRHEPSEIVAGAELYLLCEPDALILFQPANVLDALVWMDLSLLVVRLRDTRDRAYREEAVTEDGRLVRFQRVYREDGIRTARVALTADAALARAWQSAPDVRAPWRWLRGSVAPARRSVRTTRARTYDERDPAQVMACMHDIMRSWSRPRSTIPNAAELQDDVWAEPSAAVAPDATFVGPVWIGAGRHVAAGTHIVGPALLWDDPAHRPQPERVEWTDIEPARLASQGGEGARQRGGVPGKRAFDIAFALLALLVTLPLYPLVALAILLEDGRPIFFGHRRETVGGREFACLKFRSMRKDSDAIKAALVQQNQADGPQFFMADDPRVTRVGRIIRKLQIDELPQLLNVLAGHMSIVGPRPSPHSENQYCPPWREARLSVRPGITGLWQVRRTRQAGLDFQEWIRFDLEYVERASWALDLWILARTVRVVLRGLL